MTTQRLAEYDCFFCDVCRQYIYDESVGDAAAGVAARTRVDRLPASWCCPVCGASKDQLRACTMLDGFSWKEASVEDGDEHEATAMPSVTRATVKT